jgi:hypothetical protein
MTENRGKLVEEPTGYDHPPTDRIPVPGDLSDGQTTFETRPEDRLDESAEPIELGPASETAEPIEDREPVTDTAEPVTDTTEPEADTPREHDTGAVETPAGVGVFEDGAVGRFRDRWRDLQAGFVDDPAQAVRNADELVDEIMRELAERKHSIEEQWRDGPGDTEELRVAIQEYRSFLNQLLNA